MSDQLEKHDFEKGKMGGVRVTKVKSPKITKEEQALVKSQSMDVEDEFEPMYVGGTAPDAEVLRPPFDPRVLKYLCQHNNALSQLITAMEVNIDGTGYSIESKDEQSREMDFENQEVKNVGDFFNEVSPGVSFMSLRRKLRRDMEQVGYAFQEVVRNPAGEIVFINYVPAHTVRLMKLDDPVTVVKKITRMGKEMDVRTLARERRFVQIVGKKKIYFKEYGASRDLDYETGKWADLGAKLPYEKRATELQYFILNEDANSPYGLPRWANQIPSVLGSRKAEEMNLDFFNAGGLPPAAIFIQGGMFATEEVRKQLQNFMTGRGSKKDRAAIVEILSSSGNLDGSGGQVKVTVERFGSREDSLFENYDEKCENRVRSSFRLPPIFVGRTDSYSYATAFASYMVGEAQVFAIERLEFDDIITNTVVKELNPDLRMRSKPLNVKDAASQLKAIEMASAKGVIDNGTLVDNLNEITSLEMKVAEGVADKPVGQIQAEQALQSKAPPEDGEAQESVPPAGSAKQVEKSDPIEMIKLATDFASWLSGDQQFSADEVHSMMKVVESMAPTEKRKFDGYVVLKTLGSAVDHDLEGVLEVCGCAAEVVGKDGR